MGKPSFNPLRSWLNRNNSSQESLARSVGVSYNHINSLVNGKNTDIKVSTLVSLHRCTGIPYEDLVNYCQSCTTADN